MARGLIVGYGSAIRSDDAVGVRAAEELIRSPLPDVEVLIRHQLTPELAETIRQADFVIFVDAARGDTPGTIRCTRVDCGVVSERFTHQLTPAGVVSLCAELYGTLPQAWLVSVDGDCFALGDTLSPAVSEALPALVEFVRRQAADCCLPAYS